MNLHQHVHMRGGYALKTSTEKQSDREEDKWEIEQNLPSAGSLPSWPQQLQVKARSQKLSMDSSWVAGTHVIESSSTALTRSVSQKLDEEQSSQALWSWRQWLKSPCPLQKSPVGSAMCSTGDTLLHPQLTLMLLADQVSPGKPPSFVSRDALTGLFSQLTHLIIYLSHLISQRIWGSEVEYK